MIKWTKDKWQKFKKWSTVDHWIDLMVDVGLIAFDVLVLMNNCEVLSNESIRH